MLEVKKQSKGTAAPEQWPSSIYARPRVPVTPAAIDAEYLPEEILEGCRAAVQQLGVEGITTLGVTSTLRGEGRTTMALGLALALAEYGQETVLVELDLAHPQLGQRLSTAKYPGMGDIAEGRSDLADVLTPIGPRISVIPAGQVHGSIPYAISQLGRLDVMTEITDQSRVVVADLPPLLGSSVGRQAAGLMTDLVLVVRAGVAPVGRIREGVAGLATSPSVLLNATHSRIPEWAARLAGI